MKDFQVILEDCLTSISKGTATVDECLARYTEHADKLQPLLRTASFLNRGRSLMPSRSFSAYTHSLLVQHLYFNPKQAKGAVFSWQAVTAFVLLIAMFLVPITVHAQSALPGDFDYGWKRSTERVWMTFVADPLTADIVLANRRLDEWIAVRNNPAYSADAEKDYLDALSILTSTSNVNALALAPVLQAHHQALSKVGLYSLELTSYTTGNVNFGSDDRPVRFVPSVIPPRGVVDHNNSDQNAEVNGKGNEGNNGKANGAGKGDSHKNQNGTDNSENSKGNNKGNDKGNK